MTSTHQPIRAKVQTAGERELILAPAGNGYQVKTYWANGRTDSAKFRSHLAAIRFVLDTVATDFNPST